jgi:hypothetical protein
VNKKNAIKENLNKKIMINGKVIHAALGGLLAP